MPRRDARPWTVLFRLPDGSRCRPEDCPMWLRDWLGRQLGSHLPLLPEPREEVA